MRTLIVTALVMAAIIGGLWSYANVHADASEYVFNPHDVEAAPAAGIAPEEGEVVIRVNGEPITLAEFELALQSLPETARGAMASGAGRKVVAEELIRMQLLAQEAVERGLADRAEIREQLRLAGVQTELMRKNLLAQAAVQEMVQTAEASGTIEELYERLRPDFETIDARQIVIGWQGTRLTEGNATRSKAEALARAQEARKELRSGKPFEQVHQQFGDNDSMQLGPVRQDSLPEPMAEPLFAMQPGQVSEPIETPWGYHIFEVRSRTTPPLEELRPRLEAQAQQLWARVALEEMREKATVEFDDQFFAE